MAVKYTPEMKRYAREHNQKLVAIDAGGLEFSGPVTAAEQLEITKFLVGFIERRKERLDAEGERPAT